MLVLSFLACGSRGHCPGGSLRGRSLNPTQLDCVAPLQTLTWPWFSGPHFAVPLSAKLRDPFRIVARCADADVGATVKPLVPQGSDEFRSPFAKVAANFDPTPHSAVFEAAAYVEPALLELPAEH